MRPDTLFVRIDKEWSLTDCISCTVMKDRGITKAITSDHHFEQAGFEKLLYGIPFLTMSYQPPSMSYMNAQNDLNAEFLCTLLYALNPDLQMDVPLFI